MMSIMDQLTDKNEWHKKVFDAAIVSKWRAEALEIPNEHFWKLAIRDKVKIWDKKQNKFRIIDDNRTLDIELPEGIVDSTTFDNVSLQLHHGSPTC